MLSLSKRGFCFWASVVVNFNLFVVIHTSAIPGNQTLNATVSPMLNSTTNSLAPEATTSSSPGLVITEPPRCSKSSFNVCWRSNPPYIYKDSNGNITGILREILEKVLDLCNCPGLELVFRTQVTDDKGLQNCTLARDLSFVLPFQPFRKGGTREGRFLRFVESPGMVLVLNRKKLTDKAMSKVLNEVIQVWTVAVLIVLLAAIFGIIVWFLDMHRNPEEFPQTFYPGVLEGLWWSFVTLTTVGYGDKAPRYPLARLFSVIWMFVGMVMISLLTATMTTALTSGRIENYENILDKTIGVLNGSPAYEEAARKGAIPKVYPDLHVLYTALEKGEIYGLMVDSHAASYMTKKQHRPTTDLFKAYSFGISYMHGVVVGNAEIGSAIFVHCLSGNLDKIQSTVHHIINSYVRDPDSALKDGGKTREFKTNFNPFEYDSEAFKIGLISLCSILGVLVVAGILWEIVARKQRRRSRNISRKGNDTFSMDTQTKLTPVEIRQMLDKLDEVERTLTQLSEFRKMYHRLKVDITSYNTNETANGAVHPGIKNAAYNMA